MQLQTANLEETLGYEKPVPHELKGFFKARHIQPKKIAKLLSISTVAVATWLNGTMPPTAKREEQLQNLRKSIERWELKHGRMFDARDFEVK